MSKFRWEQNNADEKIKRPCTLYSTGERNQNASDFRWKFGRFEEKSQNLDPGRGILEHVCVSSKKIIYLLFPL